MATLPPASFAFGTPRPPKRICACQVRVRGLLTWNSADSMASRGLTGDGGRGAFAGRIFAPLKVDSPTFLGGLTRRTLKPTVVIPPVTCRSHPADGSQHRNRSAVFCRNLDVGADRTAPCCLDSGHSWGAHNDPDKYVAFRPAKPRSA